MGHWCQSLLAELSVFESYAHIYNTSMQRFAVVLSEGLAKFIACLNNPYTVKFHAFMFHTGKGHGKY